MHHCSSSFECVTVSWRFWTVKKLCWTCLPYTMKMNFMSRKSCRSLNKDKQYKWCVKSNRSVGEWSWTGDLTIPLYGHKRTHRINGWMRNLSPCHPKYSTLHVNQCLKTHMRMNSYLFINILLAPLFMLLLTWLWNRVDTVNQQFSGGYIHERIQNNAYKNLCYCQLCNIMSMHLHQWAPRAKTMNILSYQCQMPLFL